MESTAVPEALRARLGGEGTAGLLELLGSAQREWTGEVTTFCLDRFERRLVEETAGLRVDMAEGHATLRTDIANLRGEMTQMDGRLRTEIAGLRGEVSGQLAHTEGRLRSEIAVLRGEMSGQLAQTQGALRVELVREMQVGFGAIRRELADNRVEFLKWAFAFWVGQFFAVAGLLAVLMRTTLAR